MSKRSWTETLSLLHVYQCQIEFSPCSFLPTAKRFSPWVLKKTIKEYCKQDRVPVDIEISGYEEAPKQRWTALVSFSSIEHTATLVAMANKKTVNIDGIKTKIEIQEVPRMRDTRPWLEENARSARTIIAQGLPLRWFGIDAVPEAGLPNALSCPKELRDAISVFGKIRMMEVVRLNDTTSSLDDAKRGSNDASPIAPEAPSKRLLFDLAVQFDEESGYIKCAESLCDSVLCRDGSTLVVSFSVVVGNNKYFTESEIRKRRMWRQELAARESKSSEQKEKTQALQARERATLLAQQRFITLHFENVTKKAEEHVDKLGNDLRASLDSFRKKLDAMPAVADIENLEDARGLVKLLNDQLDAIDTTIKNNLQQQLEKEKAERLKRLEHLVSKGETKAKKVLQKTSQLLSDSCKDDRVKDHEAVVAELAAATRALEEARKFLETGSSFDDTQASEKAVENYLDQLSQHLEEADHMVASSVRRLDVVKTYLSVEHHFLTLSQQLPTTKLSGYEESSLTATKVADAKVLMHKAHDMWTSSTEDLRETVNAFDRAVSNLDARVNAIEILKDAEHLLSFARSRIEANAESIAPLLRVAESTIKSVCQSYVQDDGYTKDDGKAAEAALRSAKEALEACKEEQRKREIREEQKRKEEEARQEAARRLAEEERKREEAKREEEEQRRRLELDKKESERVNNCRKRYLEWKDAHEGGKNTMHWSPDPSWQIVDRWEVGFVEQSYEIYASAVEGQIKSKIVAPMGEKVAEESVPKNGGNVNIALTDEAKLREEALASMPDLRKHLQNRPLKRPKPAISVNMSDTPKDDLRSLLSSRREHSQSELPASRARKVPALRQQDINKQDETEEQRLRLLALASLRISRSQTPKAS